MNDCPTVVERSEPLDVCMTLSCADQILSVFVNVLFVNALFETFIEDIG